MFPKTPPFLALYNPQMPDDGAELKMYGFTTGSILLHKDLNSTYANMIYANAIKKVELGKGITTLLDNVFTSASITSVTIPAEITVFKRAFADCKGIEYLVFPKAVSNLTTSAFEDCIVFLHLYTPYCYLLSQY